MATTIRVYLDGGTTPAASGVMAANRRFSIPLYSVPSGVHTFEVTTQQDGEAECSRIIKTINVIRSGLAGSIAASVVMTASGLSLTGHALAGNLLISAGISGDLIVGTQGAVLSGSISISGVISADLTVPKPLAGNLAISGTITADLTAPGAPGGEAVFDDFNRANGALGTGWTTITGYSNPFTITSNQAYSSGTAGSLRTETFANNQYAEAKIISVPGVNETGAGVIVRCAGAATFYTATGESYDLYGDGSAYRHFVTLYRVTGGSFFSLGSWTWQAASVNDWTTDGGLIVRLEASGTSLIVRAGNTHNGLGQIISATDSNITSGAPGICNPSTYGVLFDDFYGGDI